MFKWYMHQQLATLAFKIENVHLIYTQKWNMVTKNNLLKVAAVQGHQIMGLDFRLSLTAKDDHPSIKYNPYI